MASANLSSKQKSNTPTPSVLVHTKPGQVRVLWGGAFTLIHCGHHLQLPTEVLRVDGMYEGFFGKSLIIEKVIVGNFEIC